MQIRFESVSDDGNSEETGIRDIRTGVNSSCTCTPLQGCARLTGEVTCLLLLAFPTRWNWNIIHVTLIGLKVD